MAGLKRQQALKVLNRCNQLTARQAQLAQKGTSNAKAEQERVPNNTSLLP